MQVMEFSSLLDTSLDLNAKPLRDVEEAPLPPRPPPPKQEAESRFIEFGRNATVHEDRGALVEELNRVSAENKKLTEMLSAIVENYSELRNQLVEYTNKNPTSRKRSHNCLDGTRPSQSSSSEEDSRKRTKEEEPIKAKVSEVRVRIEASDASHIVKDGYQWRKYGQKVTRDNPSPRAYFKCSFAPSCPVKKKVQKSVEDQSILVATYEGEHNHTRPHPSKVEANTRPNRSPTLGNAPSSPRITLDLIKPIVSSSRGKGEAPHLQQFLVEQMASTLTRDPSFKTALAAAISGLIQLKTLEEQVKKSKLWPNPDEEKRREEKN